MTNPWFKFYPQDWLGESALRLCTPAAKGLWIDMICIMHQSGGYLLNNGQIVTDRNLVSLTGIDESTLALLKGELETNGVFSVNNKGVIYSRRMVKDIARAKKLQKNGKFGGNPSLCKDTEKQPLDNQPVKPLDKPRSQKPDIIYGGKVIKLKQETFDSLLAETGLTDVDFAKFLDGEDDYYAKMPKHDQAKWFFFLKAKINKMKVA